MARKTVRVLLIASCILALLMAALWIWTEETPDPLTACVMTVIAAVLSIIISYRVINLPLPWGEGIHEATRDSNMFLDFGLKAVGICAVSLALYLVIRRIQGKRALTTGENA